jgi:hypothetical protein
MSFFSFDNTAGSSQSSIKPRLEGNEIYTVKFDGCEIKDIQGVKDPSQLYKVLILKFSNEDGVYEHTIFEPKEDEYQRTEREFTNKNGNVEKIPQPSGVESLMLLLKHAIDSINPTVASKIDKGEASLKAKNWEDLRKVVAAVLEPGIGAVTKIKLLKNNKGEAIFPGFFASVNRDGKAYIRNNFIGSKIAFTPYEADRIKNSTTAKPTEVDATTMFETPQVDHGLDISFKL